MYDGMSKTTCVIIALGLVFLSGVLSSCRHPCTFICRSEHPANIIDMNRCLELCHLQPCNDTDDRETEDGSNSVEKAVVKYFSSPSRWIPTVVGCLVGIGIICAVVFYSRKSWKKRDRFPSYGFSRLRRGNRVPNTDTDMTELSNCGR